MCPRDQEIISLFSVLQKRPTELSILFGKAGHRAEEDIHKAAHKFAGLAAYGPLPELRVLGEILERNNLGLFATHSFAACLWQYARSRDFVELARLLGQNGLRQQMFRAFKILHAAEGREEGLLAGWVLWLVDGSHPTEKGWMKRQRHGREYQLGPTVFRSNKVPYGQDKESITSLVPRFTGPHGRAEGAAVVKIGRKMKFMLRGATL
jgi:hypothetical protein